MKNGSLFLCVFLILGYQTCQAQKGGLDPGGILPGIPITYKVNLEFLGEGGQWHGEEKHCVINSNKDFTENPPSSFSPNSVHLLNDYGAPQPGETTTCDGAPGIRINRCLKIVEKDDRLVTVRLKVECDRNITGKFHFDINKYDIIPYWKKEGHRNYTVAPVGKDNSVSILTNKEYELQFEAIAPGKFKVNAPRGLITTVGGYFFPDKPFDPSLNAERYDYLTFAHEAIDIMIEPSNFDFLSPLDPDRTSEKVGYFNEAVESGKWGGAWMRVNSDFSKNKVDAEGVPINDNAPEGEDKYDFQESCQLKARLTMKSLGGTVKVKFPGNLILWEGEEPSLDDKYIRHTDTITRTIEGADSLLFFCDPQAESNGQGEDKIEVTFAPDPKTGIKGQNRYKPESEMHDEAAFTAVNLNIMLDGDRDGKFCQSQIQDKHLLFWWNSDRERIHVSGAQTDGTPETAGVENLHDSADLKVHQSRDMEDFTGLRVEMGELLVGAHNDGVNETETHLLDPSIVQFNSPNFHVFEWSAVSNDAKAHIENRDEIDQFIISQNGSPRSVYDNRITPSRVPYSADEDPEFDRNWEKNGFKTEILRSSIKQEMHYVLESRVKPIPYNTDLVVKSIVQDPLGSEYQLCTPVSLRVHPVEQFYDAWIIPTKDHTPDGNDKMHPNSTFYPDASDTEAFVHMEYKKDKADYQYYRLDDEQYFMFVHGWNNTGEDKVTGAETLFKRLYWQGYKGRVGYFSWPNWVPKNNDAIDKTFNTSEFNGFRSGLSLMNALATISKKYNGKTHVMAHSQGNVPLIEAVRLWMNGSDKNTNPVLNGIGNAWSQESIGYRSKNEQLIQTYLACNSAISADIFGSDTGEMETQAIVVGFKSFFKEKGTLQYFTTLADDWVPKWIFHHRQTIVTNVALTLFGLNNRWIQIESMSEYYRYFAAGQTKKSWSELFNSRIHTFPGEVFYMSGTDGVIAGKYNYYAANDFVLGIWMINMAIKGLIATSPTWDFTYSSVLRDAKSNGTGEWVFSRNPGNNFKTKVDNFLSLYHERDSENFKAYQFFKDLIEELRDGNNFYGKFASLFLNVPGQGNITLGRSVKNSKGVQVAQPSTTGYEVLAFLGRANSSAMGLRPINGFQDRNLKDMGNDTNNSCLNGSISDTPSHSFWFYHDCECTKELYDYFVKDIEKQSGIGSSYDEDNCPK